MNVEEPFSLSRFTGYSSKQSIRINVENLVALISKSDALQAQTAKHRYCLSTGDAAAARRIKHTTPC
ncbi:MAG: hypothetical protein LBN06_04800, partial [Prevotellaceae bacterium]|nr:hypothetical protein [Prevotellaceae bacterium]